MTANQRLYDNTVDSWKKTVEECVQTEGHVPEDIQADILQQMIDMMILNIDNKNKHIFNEEEAEAFLRKMGDILTDIDDAILLNGEWIPDIQKDSNCFRWVYLILKYQDRNLQYEFWKTGEREEIVFGYHGIPVHCLSEENADIQFMDVIEGKLVIEGRLSPILRMNDSVFFIQEGSKRYEPVYSGRYAHTKTFGVMLFKREAFRFEIPLTGQEQKLQFKTGGDWGESEVSVTFRSHFSRLSDRFPHSYWKMTKRLVLYPGKSFLLVKKKHRLMRQELRLWRDMLKTRDFGVIKYIPVRLYLHSRKIWKHRPRWLFLDKIYKGGDSSEYLFRYAIKQRDGIRNYYLIDAKSPDCKRLKKDGYKPVIRWSLKHRLVFLSADMIVISNSTVYAFNDMSLENSSYIRDLMNFHTVCVQHGMSVQKIAVAQNRLRDNIRLYFCASPYEIENLSKPIYGYEGTDALKLTGVPRYDGLVNRDKKQILISPTWRMQAASRVRTNEGVARDYNPWFKTTPYYRVYNSLINDPRLIAAAEQYGYRIVYVLHPIVSPQIKDFDANPHVEIVPSTGDMSYEKLFCESSLMVTDYSGVQFDFAYMRKPIVYLHHQDIPQHYEEGTFHYDTMAFGEICHDNETLINLLCEYMAGGCQMKPEYVKRADDFFAFDDHNNCQRIYDVMLDYQKNVIGAHRGASRAERNQEAGIGR